MRKRIFDFLIQWGVKKPVRLATQPVRHLHQTQVKPQIQKIRAMTWKDWLGVGVNFAVFMLANLHFKDKCEVQLVCVGLAYVLGCIAELLCNWITAIATKKVWWEYLAQWAFGLASYLAILQLLALLYDPYQSEYWLAILKGYSGIATLFSPLGEGVAMKLIYRYQKRRQKS